MDDTAFQADAFQNDAFQVGTVGPGTPDGTPGAVATDAPCSGTAIATDEAYPG